MCSCCADCKYYDLCDPDIRSTRLNGKLCMDFEDTEFDDQYSDRWHEMSYKKYSGKNCLDTMKDLEDEEEILDLD